MSEKRHLKIRRGSVPCEECGRPSWNGLCKSCREVQQRETRHADRGTRHTHEAARLCACGGPGKVKSFSGTWSCARCARLEAAGYERYTGAMALQRSTLVAA